MDYLSSFDLLLYTSGFCDINLLFTLANVSSLFRSVVTSDKCWRPRLQAALAIAASLHADATTTEAEGQPAETAAQPSEAESAAAPSPPASSPLSNCKAAYLQRFACSHAAYNACYRLIAPTPLLSHPTIVPPPQAPLQRQHQPEEQQHLGALVFACDCSPVPIRAAPLCRQCVTQLSASVKRWYDSESIFQRQFTMTPLTLALLSDAAVDVKYRHVGLYDGIDYRRFNLLTPAAAQQAEQSSGGVVVTGFQEHHSGCYALNLRENAQDSEGMSAGSLQQTAQDSVQLIRAQPPMMAAVRLVMRRHRQRQGMPMRRAQQQDEGLFGRGAQ